MKKILYAAIALSILSCAKEEKPIDYAIFSGKIENLDGGKISVRNSEKVIKDVIVLEDGTFTDTLQNIESGYYSFKYGNENSSFYLKPGYNLNLALNTQEFDETIKYTGNGSVENNYLAQKYLNEEGLGDLRAYQYLGTLTEKDFVHKMDSIKQVDSSFLNEQKDLDSNFKTLEEASITYKWVNQLNNFEAYKNYVSEVKGFKVSANFPDFEEGLNLEDENIIVVNNYNMYLNRYYSKKAADLAKKDSIDHDLAFLKTVSNDVKSSKIKEQLLYGSARYGVSYTSNLQSYYDIFMANSTNEEHKKDITEKYNKLIKLSKGQPSPKFTDYENYKGGTTSLDDLKGKYVYVDVWATWCGPCKREIPFLKEVEKKYHNKKIAFISMSIDKKKDYDKWRDMVGEKELTGIQLFAPNDWKSDFVTNYGIQGIPRFILIDPEGNIVSSNAPRPSSKKLIETFDELGI